MTTTRRFGERRITAFMEDPDNMNISNIIHATQGAQAYGYKAALVGGVTVYGWCAPAILQAMGTEWLERGWIDVSFRRPTYPGDEMTARVNERDDGLCDFEMKNQDGETCLSGELGMGTAPWLHELSNPARRIAEPRPEQVPQLTPEVAPVGRDLRPQAVPISKEESRKFSLEHEMDDHPAFHGDNPIIHPGWLAGRMTRLIHHSYTYGPAIHARSQIQNLAPAFAGQTVTVAGHFRDTYERKGHHYGLLDGLILSEDGRELTRIRHTTIYQVAKR